MARNTMVSHSVSRASRRDRRSRRAGARAKPYPRDEIPHGSTRRRAHGADNVDGAGVLGRLGSIVKNGVTWLFGSSPTPEMGNSEKEPLRDDFSDHSYDSGGNSQNSEADDHERFEDYDPSESEGAYRRHGKSAQPGRTPRTRRNVDRPDSESRLSRSRAFGVESEPETRWSPGVAESNALYASHWQAQEEEIATAEAREMRYSYAHPYTSVRYEESTAQPLSSSMLASPSPSPHSTLRTSHRRDERERVPTYDPYTQPYSYSQTHAHPTMPLRGQQPPRILSPFAVPDHSLLSNAYRMRSSLNGSSNTNAESHYFAARKRLRSPTQVQPQSVNMKYSGGGSLVRRTKGSGGVVGDKGKSPLRLSPEPKRVRTNADKTKPKTTATAKKILDSLESLSSPLNDARLVAALATPAPSSLRPTTALSSASASALKSRVQQGDAPPTQSLPPSGSASVGESGSSAKEKGVIPVMTTEFVGKKEEKEKEKKEEPFQFSLAGAKSTVASTNAISAAVLPVDITSAKPEAPAVTIAPKKMNMKMSRRKNQSQPQSQSGSGGGGSSAGFIFAAASKPDVNVKKADPVVYTVSSGSESESESDSDGEWEGKGESEGGSEGESASDSGSDLETGPGFESSDDEKEEKKPMFGFTAASGSTLFGGASTATPAAPAAAAFKWPSPSEKKSPKIEDGFAPNADSDGEKEKEAEKKEEKKPMFGFTTASGSTLFGGASTATPAAPAAAAFKWPSPSEKKSPKIEDGFAPNADSDGEKEEEKKEEKKPMFGFTAASDAASGSTLFGGASTATPAAPAAAAFKWPSPSEKKSPKIEDGFAPNADSDGEKEEEKKEEKKPMFGFTAASDAASGSTLFGGASTATPAAPAAAAFKWPSPSEKKSPKIEDGFAPNADSDGEKEAEKKEEKDKPAFGFGATAPSTTQFSLGKPSQKIEGSDGNGDGKTKAASFSLFGGAASTSTSIPIPKQHAFGSSVLSTGDDVLIAKGAPAGYVAPSVDEEKEKEEKKVDVEEAKPKPFVPSFGASMTTMKRGRGGDGDGDAEQPTTASTTATASNMPAFSFISASAGASSGAGEPTSFKPASTSASGGGFKLGGAADGMVFGQGQSAPVFGGGFGSGSVGAAAAPRVSGGMEDVMSEPGGVGGGGSRPITVGPTASTTATGTTAQPAQMPSFNFGSSAGAGVGAGSGGMPMFQSASSGAPQSQSQPSFNAASNPASTFGLGQPQAVATPPPMVAFGQGQAQPPAFSFAAASSGVGAPATGAVPVFAAASTPTGGSGPVSIAGGFQMGAGSSAPNRGGIRGRRFVRGRRPRGAG